MTTPFHVSIEIATASMIRGDFESACRRLRQSLNELRALEMNGEHLMQVRDPEAHPSFLRAPEGRIGLCIPGFEEEEDAFSPNNAFKSFKSAFLLPPLTLGMESYHVGVVLLYNLGLALHCQGMRKAKTSMLRSAKRCYELSLDLLPSTLFMDEEWGGWWKVLYMSAWTNLGNIASHFFDNDEVSICRARLLQVIEQNQSSVPSDVWNLFSQVVFELDKFGVLATAAAA